MRTKLHGNILTQEDKVNCGCMDLLWIIIIIITFISDLLFLKSISGLITSLDYMNISLSIDLLFCLHRNLTSMKDLVPSHYNINPPEVICWDLFIWLNTDDWETHCNSLMCSCVVVLVYHEMYYFSPLICTHNNTNRPRNCEGSGKRQINSGRECNCCQNNLLCEDYRCTCVL